MPLYLTVQQFQIEHTKHIKPIHIKTVYRWIEEKRVQAKKDHGGHGWLILIQETDLLFPILMRKR